MNPLRILTKAASAAFTAFGNLVARPGQFFSLVPQYLANLLWILSQEFYELATKGYKSNAAVYGTLATLSAAVGEPGLKAHYISATGELSDPLPFNHPLSVLIRYPNELMTEYEMWELATLHLGIVGRTVWYIETSAIGKPIALWPLRPDRVGPIYTTGDEGDGRVIKGWSYLVPGTVNYVAIPREQTWFANLPDPAGESGGLVEGVGPLQALASEVGADNEATKFVGAMLANYGQPGVVLQTKTPINDPDLAKQIKQSFVHEFGTTRRGLPALVDADTTVTQLGFTLQQLEFPQVRAIAEARIAAAFRTPAILVGLKTGLEQGIRATIAEQREQWTETTLSSYWRRLSTSFGRDVATKFGSNIAVQFDMRDVKALAAQGKYETERIQAGFDAGAVTIDEYREKVLRLPPLGDAYGQSFMIPTTATPTPAETALQVNPNATGGENPEDVDTDEEKVGAKKDAVSHLRVTALAQRRIAENAHTHAAALTSYLNDLADHVAARIVQPHKYPIKAEDFIPGGDLLPHDDDLKLAEILRGLYLDVVADAYDDASKTMGIGIGYDVTNPSIVGILGQIGQRITQIDDTTRKTVQSLTGKATQEGWTVKQLAQEIKTAGAFAPSRAMLIARTESGNAYNLGAIAAYKDSNVVQRVRVLDGDYDAECAAANGQVWDLAYAASHALEHPNCTRAFAPIIADAAPSSILRDLAEMKATIERGQKPFIVHKQVQRDASGQITAVIERHEPVAVNGVH